MKNGQYASARPVLLTTAAHEKITSYFTALLEKVCFVFQKTRAAPAGNVRSPRNSDSPIMISV